MAKYIKREVWIEETEVNLTSAEVMTIVQAAIFSSSKPLTLKRTSF